MSFLIGSLIVVIGFFFVSEFLLKVSKLSSIKSTYYIYYFFSVACGLFYYNYLPLAPDSLMFSKMISSGEFPISQTGTLEVLSFYFITKPIAFIIGGDINAYVFFSKAILSISLLFIFSFFVSSTGLNTELVGRYQTLLFFLSLYPSFNVVFNNIFREVYEVFFIGLVLFLSVRERYWWALVFTFFLFFIRYSDIVILASLLLPMLFSRYVKNNDSRDMAVIFTVFLIFVLIFIIPGLPEHFIDRRIIHNDFVLGFNASDCHHYFPTGAAYSNVDMFEFMYKSFVQYVMDPINISQCTNGTSRFMMFEALFSIMLLGVIIIVSVIRKTLKIYIVGLFLALLLQSLYEYYVQAGMRHRVIVYMLFIYYLVFTFKPIISIRCKR